MIAKTTLQFLTDLKTNNHRAWFLSQELAYTTAKANVLNNISSILLALEKTDKRFSEISPASCLFRINRDVRFSANKAPYKTNFGAALNIYGKKSVAAGFYLHIEPGNSFIGGGMYMPPSNILEAVRQEIDYQYEEFSSIINAPLFVKQFGALDMSYSLKKVPRPYNMAHPAAPWLKLKSFVAFKEFSDKAITNITFDKKAIEALIALMPLINFLNRCVENQ